MLRGPVSYSEFKQQVRRFRRSGVLLACARLNSLFQQIEMGVLPPLRSVRQDVVHDFALAGVARAALVGGNEHRDKSPDLKDLERLCWYYVNVDDPDRDIEPGLDHLRRMFARFSYEQFGSQLSPMEQVGRSLVLFEDLADGVRGMPQENDWRLAFGASVQDLIETGFVAFAAANQHRGVVPVDVMGDDRFTGRYGSLTPADALVVLDRFYTSTVDNAAQYTRNAERPGYEKWSPTPLARTPILTLPNGDRVVVWPNALLARFSPPGLFYAGIEAFGPTFSDALGGVFETYVGNQLRLIRHATIHPEIKYRGGGQEKKTCDWIVVTDACVVLVEVKATRPVLSVRTGEADGLDDLTKKIGKAADQLDNTARMIQANHDAVSHIPNDRPLVGLVMTLEPFFLMEDWLYGDLIGGKSIPITVSYAHVLEGVTTLLSDRADAGDRLLTALMEKEDPGGVKIPARLDRAEDDLKPSDRSNPILAKAWERILQPTL